MRRGGCVVLILVAGCGGGEKPQPRTPPRPSEPVIFLSRTIGEDPMVDDITVGANRRVEVRRLRGGAGARFDDFAITRGEAARLQRAVARLGARPPSLRRRVDRWYYQLRLDHHEPFLLVAGHVPGRARPALRLLQRLIDDSARRAG